jgi:molybdate transport system permease protein
MMEWDVLWVTLKLALTTALITTPIGIAVGRWLAFRGARQAWWADVLLLLPLLIPPTVVGLYFLTVFAGTPLVFSFLGLVVASVFVNIPFAAMPIRRAWEQIPVATRETAACCGWSPWKVFTHCELPQAWGGVVSAFALVAAHTVGEFGVVMMVGGNLAGETRTLAVAVYDHVQAMRMDSAHALALIAVAFGVLIAVMSNVLTKPKRSAR